MATATCDAMVLCSFLHNHIRSKTYPIRYVNGNLAYTKKEIIFSCLSVLEQVCATN